MSESHDRVNLIHTAASCLQLVIVFITGNLATVLVATIEVVYVHASAAGGQAAQTSLT